MRLSEPVDYARLDYVRRESYVRLKRRIEGMPRKLICQDCGGAGGGIDDIVIPETGEGPWEQCGFCRGIGYVTPWMRGQWLRWKAEDKRNAKH